MGTAPDAEKQETNALLAARNITVVRGGRTIVNAATIALARAQSSVTIQGSSGSGKSTFLRAIATLIPKSGGTITFEGRTPEMIGVAEYRRRVAYVPQLPAMFEGTVADNVRAGPRFQGITLADDKVIALIDRVGLGADIAARSASDVSGGERLRVALARALANDPRVLLLDEPTSALDPDAAQTIVDLIVTLVKSGTTAVLTVTHSEEHAARIGGDRYRMTSGVLSAEGGES